MLDSYNNESYRRKIDYIQSTQGGRRLPERESGLSPGHIMAGVGLAAAGTIAMRRGGIAKIGRYADREGRAAYRSAKEVLSNASPIFKADTRDFGERLKGMRDEFKASYEANKKFIDENPSRRRSRDTEVWLKNIDRMLGSERRLERTGKEGQLLERMQDQFRFNHFIKEVSQSETEFMKVNRDSVVDTFSRVKPFELKNMDADGIKELLANKKVSTTNDDVDEIYGYLTNAKMKMQKNDDVYNAYKIQQDKLYKEFLSNIIGKESVEAKGPIRKGGSKLFNSDYLTVGDILADHQKFTSLVDDETFLLLRKATQTNKDFSKVVFDRNLRKRKNTDGSVSYEDYAVIDEVVSDAASWYSKSFFGGILQLRNTLNLRNAKKNNSFTFFDRGTAQPFVSGALGNEATDALGQTYVAGMGKVYRATDFNEIVNEVTPLPVNPNRDITVMPLRDGSFGRMYESMAGARAEGKERNAFFEALDIGNQDMDSTAAQIASVFTKFRNPDWNRNFIKKVNTTGIEDADELYKLQTYLSIHSLGITDRGVKSLRGMMSDDMQNLVFGEGVEFSQQAHRLKMFEDLGASLEKRIEAKESAAGLSVIENRVLSTYRQYIEDPYGFSLRTTNIGISNPLLNHHSRQRTGFDEIDQHLSMAIFDDIFKVGKTTKGDIIERSEAARTALNDAFDAKQIDAKDLQHAEESLNYAAFLGSRFNRRDISEASIESVNNYVQSSEGFRLSLERMGKRTDTMYSRYVPAGDEGVIQSDFIAVGSMDKFSVSQWNRSVDKLEAGETGEALKDLFSPVTQFFAGRKNMEDVTTATVLPYYMNYRLQDALGTVGLSFSDKSLGSTHGIMMNLLTKRILPPVVAYQAFEFADYAMDSVTGAGFTERYETMKANQDIKRSQNMSDQDRYEVMKSRQLRPGAEHLAAMPEFSLPILGPVGPGRLLSTMASVALMDTSFSLDERAEMTEEEVRDDLYYGVEEVRKSRWWFAGSSSAYRGDRITMFRPNSFRMAHSDWEDAGVGLTRKERWQNSMLPNPLNPLGGLSHLLGLRDPYYFENKHYYDRPYLLTGQYFNPNTMFFGDIGNALVGNIIKPVREMHEEYWAEPMIARRDDAFTPDDIPAPLDHAYKITASGNLDRVDLGIRQMGRAGTVSGGVGESLDEEGLVIQQPDEMTNREALQREYDSLPGRINTSFDESLGYIDLSDSELKRLEERYQAVQDIAGRAAHAYPERGSILDNMILFTPKISRSGEPTGDFLLSEFDQETTTYVSAKAARSLGSLSFGEFVEMAKANEARQAENKKPRDIIDTYVSSAEGRGGRIVAGINDFAGANMVMGGMHSTAPTEMVMGNQYTEVSDHSQIQREVRMRANMHPNEYGPVTQSPNPYRRFALENKQGVGTQDDVSYEGWTDMSGTERLQGELPVNELNDPRSVKWRAQEAIENWTEPLGVYKWLVKDEVFGHDSYKGKAVIQTADAATNVSNSFWETNLGSLGGPISEIGRRFIRKDSGFLDFYNPIRNQMPDWLPSDNYFINFQEGDPYGKIEGGEYRLPGAAYESLNELHSDQFGRDLPKQNNTNCGKLFRAS